MIQMRQAEFKISKRKKQLAVIAEEEAAKFKAKEAARLKAKQQAAGSQETDPPKGDADGQTAPSTPTTAARSLSAAGSLSLHPSLPAKPRSPVKVPEALSLSEAPSLQEDGSEPKRPKTYEELCEEDEELNDLEEVSGLSILIFVFSYGVCSSRGSESSGQLSARPGKCTCNTSARLEPGILCYSHKRLRMRGRKRRSRRLKRSRMHLQRTRAWMRKWRDEGSRQG